METMNAGRIYRASIAPDGSFGKIRTSVGDRYIFLGSDYSGGNRQAVRLDSKDGTVRFASFLIGPTKEVFVYGRARLVIEPGAATFKAKGAFSNDGVLCLGDTMFCFCKGSDSTPDVFFKLSDGSTFEPDTSAEIVMFPKWRIVLDDGTGTFGQILKSEPKKPAAPAGKAPASPAKPATSPAKAPTK